MELFWGKYWKTKAKTKRIRDTRADKGYRIRETKQGWGIYSNRGLSMNRAALWRD